MKNELTFNAFQQASLERSEVLDSFHDCRNWGNLDWLGATQGELGEAFNVNKKISRGDFNADPSEGTFQLAVELADTISYATILIAKLGYNVGDVIAAKFNVVNDKYNYGNGEHDLENNWEVDHPGMNGQYHSQIDRKGVTDLAERMRELCHAIERIPAGEEQTAASIMAAELSRQVEAS